MKLKDFYWVAGFLEGEGSFITVNRSGRRHPRVSATQKQLEPLKRLQSMFGGSISTDKNGMSHWEVSGATARGIALTVFTMMSPRRKEQIKAMFSNDTSKGRSCAVRSL